MKKIIALLLAAVMLTALTGCDHSQKDYETAVGLYEAGNYAAAKEAFLALGEYENCAELVTECDYQMAIQILESGDLEAAVNALSALGTYREADVLAEKTANVIAFQQVIGHWNCDVDATEAFLEAFRSGMDEEMASYFTFPSLTVSFLMSINPEGNFTFDLDSSAVVAYMESVKTVLSEGLDNYVKDSVLVQMAQELEMSAEELSATLSEMGIESGNDLLAYVSGVTIQEMLDGLLSDEVISSLVDSMDVHVTGTVTLDGSTVTFTDENGEIDIATLNEADGTMRFPLPENIAGISELTFVRQ